MSIHSGTSPLGHNRAITCSIDKGQICVDPMGSCFLGNDFSIRKGLPIKGLIWSSTRKAMVASFVFDQGQALSCERLIGLLEILAEFVARHDSVTQHRSASVTATTMRRANCAAYVPATTPRTEAQASSTHSAFLPIRRRSRPGSSHASRAVDDDGVAFFPGRWGRPVRFGVTDTWPTPKPWLAAAKRQSVMRATSLPAWPTMALVGANISSIAGRPSALLCGMTMTMPLFHPVPLRMAFNAIFGFEHDGLALKTGLPCRKGRTSWRPHTRREVAAQDGPRWRPSWGLSRGWMIGFARPDTVSQREAAPWVSRSRCERVAIGNRPAFEQHFYHGRMTPMDTSSDIRDVAARLRSAQHGHAFAARVNHRGPVSRLRCARWRAGATPRWVRAPRRDDHRDGSSKAFFVRMSAG